jgi:hypothetical protein
LDKEKQAKDSSTVSLERFSAVLACERSTGSHTFDKIAKELNDTNKQYNIQHKVVKTVTDNGAYFCQAFKEYAGQTVLDNDDDDDDAFTLNSTYVDNFLAQDTSNNNNIQVIQLPLPQRCAVHTLNLVATKDAEKALVGNSAYKALVRSTHGKCSALWNKTSHNVVASEVVKEVAGMSLVTPNHTR